MATLRKITLNWEIRTGAITCDTGYIKRQELCDVDLYVTVDGTAYALDTSWALNLSIKPTLLGDNAALVAVTTWTASATTGLYQATAQTMGGTALDTYLAANNADTTDDEGNKLVDLDVYYTISTAVKSKSDTVTVILKPDVGRADDTVPATIIARNDFLVTNGTGLLVNVAAGYAANGAFVAAQASLAITNATNYIEVTAAGVASVNTTAFTAGSYPLATVVASAGAITGNTDLRAWITPKPAAAGGVTSITGTANEITVTGTTTPTLSLPSALTFTGKTVTGGTFTSGAFNGTVGATTPSTVAGTTGTFSGAVTGATFNTVKLNLGLGNDSRSIALGDFALASTTTGSNNYAFGRSALNSTTTGSDNLALGGGALALNVTGDGNTAIGASALLQALGSRNVALGQSAGQYETGSNSLYIDNQDRSNTAGDKAKALLYGTFAATAAAQQLTINAGTITLNGSAVTATSYAGAGTGLTGTAASLTAGTVTTNANLTGHVTSVGNAAVLGSFTMAQLSTAVSDGDPAYVGAANTFTTGQTISSTTSLLLGTAGSAVGNVGFNNATSGTTTLRPATGALGTGTVTLPLTGTLATLDGTETLTNKSIVATQLTGTIADARNTVSNTTTTSMANLVTVGTLTGGATGAGFTVALSTSTITGSLADARLSANVPLINASNTYTGTTNSFTIGTTTGVTTAAGVAFNANSLTTGTGIYAASSSLTSGKLLDLQVSGTAAAAAQTALNVATAGANGTSGITSKGAVISNTHTGTTSTNYALELTASGGTTDNIALRISGGIISVGTGSKTNPVIAYGADTRNGWYFRSGGIFTFTDSTVPFELDSSQGLKVKSTLGLFWSSGFPDVSASDTNITRNAAGIVQFGTGTTANASGSWTATNGTLSGTLAVTGASTLTGLLTTNGGITLGDAQNIAFNTTTGTKIGATTSQKLSFWNATPIAQPTTAVASATVASPGGGVNIKTDDTFDGYTIAQVVKALRNAGLLA